MAYIEAYVRSEVLSQEIPVGVIIPQDIEKDEKLKTVWLYHGGTGDHTAWDRMTMLELYARERHVACVIPTVHKSLFTNMEFGFRYGDFVGDELVEIMRRTFPALSHAREDNYVCGLSNGAYGAMRAGLKYADTFSVIGAFSGGEGKRKEFYNDGTYLALRNIMVFGEGDKTQTEHDVRFLAKQRVAQGGPFPRIFQTRGALEGFAWVDYGLTDFFNAFEGRPYDYTFRVYEGYGHEWRLWDRCIEDFFDYLGLEKGPISYM